MSYAAGALPEPLAAAVAAHAALCPDCRAQVRDLRSLGGVLLDEVGAASRARCSRFRSVPERAEVATAAGSSAYRS